MLYDQLLTKVNGIEGKISNTNWLINKSQYETDKENLLKKRIKDVDKEIPNTTSLFKNIDRDIKITETEIK